MEPKDVITNNEGLVQTGTSSFVNPNNLSESGLAQARNFASSAITSSTLGGNQSPVSLPDTPTPTIATELSGYATALGDQQKERDQLLADQEAQAKESQQSVLADKSKG